MIVATSQNETSSPKERKQAEESKKKEEEKEKLTTEQKERIKRSKEAAMKRKNGVEIKLHPIHQQWCKSEKEHAYTRGVQGFLGKLKWKSEENKEGGITWIELYALYSIHGGSRDEEERKRADPLNNPPMLQAQVAEFKKAVRKIRKLTVSLMQERQLETSAVMRNRLSKAAFNNRQAAIKGIPVMTK